MLQRFNATNRVGDKRGINGAQGERGSNGRFCSKKGVASAVGGVGGVDGVDGVDGVEAATVEHNGSARAVRRRLQPRPRQSNRPTTALAHAAAAVVEAVQLAVPLPQPDPATLPSVLSITPMIAPIAPIVLPIARAPSIVETTASAETATTETLVASEDAAKAVDDMPLELIDLVRMAAGPTLFQHRFVCSFDDLTSHAVLDAIERREKKELPTARKATYFSFLVYQCAFDRRDQGGRLLPHVVVPNVMLPVDDLRIADGDVTIEPVSAADLAMQAACARIFIDRGLFWDESYAEVILDMLLYTTEPFHFLAAKRGGVVVGAVVFRAHELNTRARLVTLELLATASTAAPGVGSALMRVMRELSQVTPRSIGFVAAACLKTAGARRFYHRKLPEVESPLARALMVSMSIRDPDSILKNYLELRCVSVMP